MSKRPALKQAIGQTQLLEIIDHAYDNASDCPNCKALMEWWEKYGATMQPAGVIPSGQKGRRG